jgi:hypothetical protein
MFDAICRMRHKQGDYDDYKVYQYLDYLRQNGIAMAFKKAVNEENTRRVQSNKCVSDENRLRVGDIFLCSK